MLNTAGVSVLWKCVKKMENKATQQFDYSWSQKNFVKVQLEEIILLLL